MSNHFPEVEGLGAFPPEILVLLLNEAQEQGGREHPFWIQVMGIPGSGKTTLVRMLKEALDRHAPYTLASFDEYMVQIPEYRQEKDRAAAFARFEAPARAAGSEVFKRLIGKKANVLFEHSTTFPAVRDLMYFIKSSGYRLVLVRVEVDVGTAKKRVAERELITGRHVPESLIEERAAIASDRWHELSRISDAAFSVANNGDEAPEEAFRAAVARVSDFVSSLR